MSSLPPLVEEVTIGIAFDYFPGNHGLTEKVLYENLPILDGPKVPVYSGSSNNSEPIAFMRLGAKNDAGRDIVYFSGPALIITKDGSAGVLTYIESGTFTCNHHAAVLKPKSAFSKLINLEWFASQYRTAFVRYTTSQSDNRVLNTEWFSKVYFALPNRPTQDEVAKIKRMVIATRNAIVTFSAELRELSAQVPVTGGTQPHSLSEIFTIVSGNSGLTEELIYNNWPIEDEDTGLDDGVEVFSASTQTSTAMGRISVRATPDGARLKICEGPCIIVARKGQAGSVRIVGASRFAINDDAYVLKVKAAWSSRINLRWIATYLAAELPSLTTSKSDNATLSKDYMARLVLKIPDAPWQDSAGVELEAIDSRINMLDQLVPQLDEIGIRPIV